MALQANHRRHTLLKHTHDTAGDIDDAALSSNVALLDRDNIASGTYTPSTSSSSNLDSATYYTCQWLRIGNVVHVSGMFILNATATGATVLKFSLPVASAFAAQNQCAGIAANAENPVNAGRIDSDGTDDVARLVYYAVDTASDNTFMFTLTYLVV